MADRIKGITVQLGGDTTGLSKALKDVNKDIQGTQTQLRDVNRLLKLDPTNTKLLTQKQRLLKEEIGATKDKLRSLKEAEKQVQQQFKEGKVSREQYEALQREIADTEQKLKSLKDEARDFGGPAAQVFGQIGDKIKNFGSKLSDAGKKMLPLTGTILGIGAAAIKTGASFDKSMSKVKALSGAGEEDFQRLRQAALDAGETTAFSAQEAADALGYMALAGWDVDDSIAALPAVLNLAAAGDMELAAASDMVTDFLSAFGLEADQAAYFTDLMAYAQANSNTSAEQLGEAYKNCAANLHAAGQDVETTTSLLELLANQNLKGSEAGTAMSAIMRDITSGMKNGAIQIGKTSVSVQDADGNFRDLTDILTDVEDATGGMGTAQKAAALGSTFTADSIKGLNIILSQGMDTAKDYEEQLRNSLGTAGDQAATQLDNFSGQMTLLGSALQSGAIAVADVLTPAVSTLVGYVQQVVDWFNGLDETQKRMIVTVALIVAAIGPLLMILGAIASGIGSIVALVGLIATPVGLAVAAVVAGVAIVIGLIVLITTHIEQIQAFFAQVLTRCKDLWAKFISANLAHWETFKANIGEIINGIIEFFEQVGVFLEQLFNRCKDMGTNFISMSLTQWEEFKEGFKGVVNAIIGFVNGMVSAVVSGVNAVIRALNSIKVDVPDWVPGIGGKSFGFALSEITAPQIPLLAKGGTLLQGSAIVGEAGPELLSLTPGGARVTPLGKDRPRAAGNSVVIHARFSGYAESDAKKLVRIINRELGKVT